MVRFRFGLLYLSALMIIVPPVAAQDTQPLPPGSPWWAVIVLSVVGLVVEIVRRLVIRSIEGKIAKEKAAYDALVKQAESEESERKRRFELEMARIQGERAAESATAQQIVALTGSINAMTQQIGIAYGALATDRQQAATERHDFRTTLDNNTAEVTKLVLAVKSLISQTDILIQLHQQDPANESVKHAMQEVTPEVERTADLVERAALPPTEQPKSEGEPSRVHSPEAP